MALRRALILALFAAASLVVGAAEAPRTLQERVKATFLYKFAAYVEWPDDAFPEPDSPIVIGVAGSHGVAQELETALAGRQVAGRALKLRRLGPSEPPDQCCQILFVGAGNERAHASALIARVRGLPVLTVTEAEKEHPDGSVINFQIGDNKVRFDISRDAEERNGLHLRSQLLGVARQVVSR
jgi:hypothetical protein